MRNWSLWRGFRYLGYVMAADCREDEDIQKNRKQNVVGNMLVRKFLFAPTEEKIQLFKWFYYQIHRCALWRHSYQNSRKPTVSYSDTFKRLINVPRYTSSSLEFVLNATDHINVFHKSAYSLMNRVTASSNSIVTAIVNSDAYQQSPVIDKCESILYV